MVCNSRCSSKPPLLHRDSRLIKRANEKRIANKGDARKQTAGDGIRDESSHPPTSYPHPFPLPLPLSLTRTQQLTHLPIPIPTHPLTRPLNPTPTLIAADTHLGRCTKLNTYHFSRFPHLRTIPCISLRPDTVF